MNFNLKQILPDIFNDKNIRLKEAYILKSDKKKTGMIMEILKECKLISDKVYLYDNIKTEGDEIYSSGKFDKNYTPNTIGLDVGYKIYDISFLKRVKPINEKENLILINFKDVIYIFNTSI